jgi:hypothetical protein
VPPDSFPLTADQASPRLQLPYLAAGQAQKHVTVNETISALDGLIQTAVESAALTAEPAAPPEGALYILPAGRAGPEWALHPAGSLLRYADGGWTRLAANDGAVAYVKDEGALLFRAGGAWRPIGQALGQLQNLSRLGLATEADAVNPLSAKLNKALFAARGAGEGGDGDLRITFNKEAASDVLSLLFQSGFSGRAELGLVGDDDLQLKVSADGAAWREAVRVERGTGRLWADNIAVTRSAAPNLLPDSGRFGDAAYVAPTYLSPAGDNSFSAHARFIHDNADFGGPGPALDPEIRALVELSRPPDGRRYGSAWWAMKIRRGTSLIEPWSDGVQTYGLVATWPVTPLLEELTVGYWLRVLSGKAAVFHWAAHGSTVGATAYVPANPPSLIAPADGWRFVSLRMKPNLHGYEYNLLALRATAGAELLLAQPRVLAGAVKLPAAPGVLPNARMWG